MNTYNVTRNYVDNDNANDFTVALSDWFRYRDFSPTAMVYLDCEQGGVEIDEKWITQEESDFLTDETLDAIAKELNLEVQWWEDGREYYITTFIDLMSVLPTITNVRNKIINDLFRELN